VKFKIKSSENFWSGLIFIGFGILAVVISRDYPMGSAMRMGPGYFPRVLGSILIVLGAIIAATSFKVEGEGIEPFAWRPMILLSAAFAFFGWTIDHVGFIPSLFGLIVLSAASGREFKWREVLIMTTALITGAWAIFIWGLELPFPLFCWR
jgi:hypothetical protein